MSLIKITLGLLLMVIPGLEQQQIDWTRKEVGAIILMTTEFLKDMDMKMRDVHRIEKYYYGTHDFGAGRIFAVIESKFDHMVQLYKNASLIMHIMGSQIDLQVDVVGSLQLMLSDYMELLTLIEMFKERYSYWRANSDRNRMRDIIKKFLIRNKEYPHYYEQEEDQWRRSMGGRNVSRHRRTYITFEEWRRLFSNYFEDFE